MRYVLPLALTLAICFALQSLALNLSGGRTTKSESNYFSSLGRIQAASLGQPEIVLLGSSITGRLPDRSQGYRGFANMGCDGGSAVDALRAMDEGILPTAPWIIIEANTLQLALKPEASEISMAMRRPWFKVGSRVPAFSAYARPAAFFYSKLLARKIGSASDLSHGASREADLGVESSPSMGAEAPATTLPHDQEILVTELSGILRNLSEQGSEVMLVWLPPARADQSTFPPWILELARRSDIPWWDLGQEADPRNVTLTDGVHMAPSSAARTVRSLEVALEALGRQ